MTGQARARPPSLYGLAWAHVSADGPLRMAFACSAVLHAAGHAGSAWTAGWLGSTLLAGPGALPPVLRWPGAQPGPLALAFVGLAWTFVKGSGAAWSATLQSRIAGRAGNFVRSRVLDRLLAFGGTEADALASARIAVRIREVERGVEEGILGGIRAALQLLPLAGALVLVGPRLALGAVAVVGPFALVTAAVRGAWRRHHARSMALAERLHAEVDDVVRHADVWRVAGANERARDAVGELGAEAVRATARAEGGRAALSGANEVLAAAALAAALALGAALHAEVAGATLLMAATMVFMAYRPLRDLGDARSALARGEEALAALESLTAGTDGAPDRAAAAAWPLAPLALEGLGSARVPSATRTTLVVEPGTIVVVAGPTGVGKTTLIRALLGLEPAVGRLRYDGRELTGAGVGPAERPFAWSPQEAPVLAGTLIGNVLPAGGEPAVAIAVLEAIGAGRLVREAGEGRVGAGGRALSGGERRWIAAARAIASGLPVLLLDEPTEGLHELAESRLLAALERLRGARTVIIVTHRRGPLRIADRVVRIGEAEARADARTS